MTAPDKDALARAVEALEREVAAAPESDDFGVNDPAVISWSQANTILSALRERDAAVAQAWEEAARVADRHDSAIASTIRARAKEVSNG